jgi:hypothetical protein
MVVPVVAIASVATRAADRGSVWIVASVAVLAIGTLVRLAVRPIDVTAVSATLLAALLWIAVWVVALLLTTPRRAFVVGSVAMLVLDIAALPARTFVPYDQREALYQVGQTLAVPAAASERQVVVLVEPVFAGDQPVFGLEGWSCPWRRGLQYLVLPVAAATDRVELRLTGTPNAEREYLVVYSSSTPLEVGSPAVRCSAR